MLILKKSVQIATHPLMVMTIMSVLSLFILFILLSNRANAERNILFPILGGGQFSNDYDGHRASGRHEATDIFANKHTPLVAAVDGTITYVGYPQPSWGYMVQITDSQGYEYNYIHINNDTPGTDDGQGGPMNAYAADMKRGNKVVKGQLIGWVGDSGNAEDTPPHLHFEVVRPDGTTVNPYELLLTAPRKHTINRSDYPQLANENLPFGRNEPGINLAVGDMISSKQGEEIVVGAGRKGGPHVKIYESNMAFSGRQFFAYNANFTGGVDVASGDVDGDGQDEIITGAGAGGGPHVKVFKSDGTVVASFFAYNDKFTGGVYVASGDVDGDGQDEIITGAGAGGGPHVKVFKSDGTVVASFFAYNANFTGGVDVSAGNTSGDNREEIIVAAGPGGGPHVRVLSYSPERISGVSDFFVYNELSYHGGVRVSAGRVTGSGNYVQIATAPHSNGGPHIKLLTESGATIDNRMFLEEWWYGFHDIAAGDGFSLASSGINRRATVRQAF